MLKHPIKIAGLGRYVAGKKVTNDDLSKTLDTNDEWISIRTGIKQRYITEDDTHNSDLAVGACSAALKDAGLEPEDIDIFMLATFTPDRLLSSTACIIQGKLGLSRAWCFDLQASCSGFLYCLRLAAGLLAEDPSLKILICGSERISRMVNWQDRSSCILFGDGASAFVVNRDDGVRPKITDLRMGSDGRLSGLITIPHGASETPLTPENIGEGQHFMQMEGRTVFKQSVRVMAEVCQNILAANGLTINEVSWLVPHQANQRILDQVGKKLEIDPARVYSNVARYGNISAASIPLAICEMRDKGDLLKKGDLLLLTAFGAGLTWGAGLMTW